MNRWKLNKYQDYNIVNRVKAHEVQPEQISILDYKKAHEVQPEPPEQRPREKSRNQERININKGRIHEDHHTWLRSLRLFVSPFIHIFMWSSPPTLIITFVIFS